MKFLDSTGLGILWNKIKSDFFPSEPIIIETNIPEYTDIKPVTPSCMLQPTGAPMIVNINGYYQLGLLDGTTFNGIQCGNLSDHFLIGQLVSGRALKNRILHSNNAYYVPSGIGSFAYQKVDNLGDAFERLYVNNDTAITTSELNEVLV